MVAEKRENDASADLVSVVVPTHNRAELLRMSIQSILAQTYQNLEIIVVDDASTDITPQVVTGFNDQRIRYIRHNQKRGGSAARNTGIRAASGVYIAFLDDDDQWEPDKTVEQLKMFEYYNVVLCTSNEPGRGTSRLKSKQTVTLEDLQCGRFTAGGTGVLMARAEILKSTLFDEDLPKYQDWDLFIRLAQSNTLGYLNKRLVRYNEGEHQRISNLIKSLPSGDLERQYRMISKHRAFFGPFWFRWHMCRGMLYGIKHRPNKGAHILYTIRRFGVLPVLGALGARFWEKAVEQLVHR